MPTLNQIIQELRTTALSHKQVKEFYFGSVDDFLAVKGRLFPSVICEMQNGSIGNKQTTLSFQLFFLDLVNLADGSKENRNDVWSDQLQVCEDMIAMITDQRFYRDWNVEPSSLEWWDDYKGDYLAGCSIVISMRKPFEANRCAIPKV